MITEELLMYMLFHLIVFAFTLVGYAKVPWLLLLTLCTTAIITVPTLIAFEDYIYFGLMLCLINMTVPTLRIAQAVKD